MLWVLQLTPFKFLEYIAMSKPFANVHPESDPGRIHAALMSALVKYDQRQARGKSYNPYAIGQYMGAVQDALRMFGQGLAGAVEPSAAMRAALVRCFTGRLLDVVLRAVSLPPSTRDEQRI